jgi:MFS transporter, SET family, sugar efflux transporter
MAFLGPALAMILVTLHAATDAQVGLILTANYAGGFLAGLVLPAWADRPGDFVRPMIGAALCSLTLAVVLALAGSLLAAAVALVVLGAPASVGGTMMFAHLRSTGASAKDIMDTRALYSFAWVAGPPVASAVMAAFGGRAILACVAGIAAVLVGTSIALLRSSSRAAASAHATVAHTDRIDLGGVGVAAVLVAFAALGAANNAGVSMMNLFVTRTAHLDQVWAGVALGVAAGLEIPALLYLGRLGARVSSLTLLASGCVSGALYYAGVAVVGAAGSTGSVPALIALQVLNAWAVAVVSGVGLTFFQRVVARPGLASGLYMNARQVGSIVSGPVIGIGSASSLGYGGIYVICASLSVFALAVVVVVGRSLRTRS